MSDQSISMSLPLDSDGFLRRECPSCKRQFKWRPAQPNDEAVPEPQENVASPDFYYCPYCGDPAALDQWWTQEQIEYAQQLAMARVLGPELRELGKSIQNLNRSSGGFIKAKVSLPDTSEPTSLQEPDDMIRLDFPCHPEEPLKIAGDWDGQVHCLVDGMTFPQDALRAME